MSDRGVRDLDWIINSIQCDFFEDDDEVNGNWRIVRRDNHVYVLFEPYDDGSQPEEFTYPPKATRYKLHHMETVEGSDAIATFERWTK
jgi:hypothetical protein